MIRRAVACLALLALSLAGGWSRAEACKCWLPSEFLVLDGAHLPGNAVGVPWWAPLGGDEPPDRRHFQVQRLVGNKLVSVPFDLRPWGDDVFLIMPKSIESGATYVFVGHSFGPSDADDEAIRVAVTFDRQDWNPDATPLPIAGGPQERKTMGVSSGAGACSAAIDAAQRQIRFVVPPEVQPWLPALFVTTRVDGRVWRPSGHLCDPTGPGQSRSGNGTEILFSGCDRSVRADVGLESGEHIVQIQVNLPGTDKFATSVLTFTDLQCADPLPTSR
jgi:hypothetical protein